MSDLDTSEVSIGSRSHSERFLPDSGEAAQDVQPGLSEREGLPRGYRMRADAHYVEQLTGRRERTDRSEPIRGTSATGSAVDQVPGGRQRMSDRVMAQVGEEIATIAAAAGMLAGEMAPLARRVGLELVRAQAWRAAWLLNASAIVDGRHAATVRPTPLGSIVEQLRQGLTPECRLAGVSLHLQASDANALVAVDVSAVTAGVTGAVVATLGAMGAADGATICVTFEASGYDLKAIEVAQDLVSVPSAVAQRFFDPTWADHPGGWTASMGALTARAVARSSGGAASFVLGDRRGSLIRLTLRP